MRTYDQYDTNANKKKKPLDGVLFFVYEKVCDFSSPAEQKKNVKEISVCVRLCKKMNQEKCMKT